MAKQVTREQAARKKSQAAAFMERIGQSDHADEFERMSVDDYAEHKGLRLSNPTRVRRRIHMPATAVTSKADLQDQIDRAIETLDDSYTPESAREDLAAAVGQALDILRGDDEPDEEEDDELDDEDSDELGN
jgi:hypothetical protein